MAASNTQASQKPSLKIEPPPQDESFVVTRAQFLETLVQMKLPKRRPPADRCMEIRLEVGRSVSYPTAPPALQPPPGFAPRELENGAMPAVASPPEYQVLLRGLPDSLMHVPEIIKLIKAVALVDTLLRVDMRKGGKILVVFSDLESVRKCIRHFHGLHLGAVDPVTALYVQTVKRPLESGSNKEANELAARGFPLAALYTQMAMRPAEPARKAVMSANAEEFVPLPMGLWKSNPLAFDRSLQDSCGSTAEGGPDSHEASEAFESD